MSYESALEAAGAVVHAFESFGSYQGDWYALVTYNGETGWVAGSYGSCSGCDAFEAEFGWSDPTTEELCAFGVTYLDGVYSQDQQEQAMAARLDGSWYSREDQEAYEWVKSFRGKSL